ncbi:MAG: acetolactate synthase small subunit [Anaerolineae bacterium]|nr:acetolactate synthase small subunit [Anaerolineae bacterium]
MPENTSSKHTVVALVENQPGVLMRVTNLFRRRNFNIDSLSVGRTHRENVSRMTIVVDSARANPQKIMANLLKLVPVIDVANVGSDLHVSRDLALVKVRSDDAESRNALTTIVERYPARIVDIGPKYAIVEITAQEDRVAQCIEELEPIGIVEMVRTGVVAMGRGTRILDSSYERAAQPATNGYHV